MGKDKTRAAKIYRVDGTVEDATFVADDSYIEQVYKAIGCDMVEVVNVPGDAQTVLLVDEDGLMRAEQKPNIAVHREFGLRLVGDVARVPYQDWR